MNIPRLTLEELLFGLYYLPMAVTSPFISWYFYNLSEGDWIGVGLIIAIPYIFLIFSTALFGRLSDIFGSRTLVIISLSAYSLSFLCYYMIGDNPDLFFVVYIAFNLIISAFIPSFNRHISFHEEEERAEKFGKLGMMASLGFLLGSFMASLLIDEIGLHALFPIAALISFIAVIFALRLNEVSRDTITQYSSNTDDPINDDLSIFVILVLVFITQLSGSLYTGLFAVFVEIELNQPVSWVAIVNSIATLLGVITTYSIGKVSKNIGMKVLFLIALFLYALLPFFTYIFVGIPLVVFILYSIPLYSIFFVLVPVFISTNSPEGQRGKAMGLYIASQYLGLSIGSMGGAFFASITGKIRPNMLISFLVGIIGIFIGFFFFKERPQYKVPKITNIAEIKIH